MKIEKVVEKLNYECENRNRIFFSKWTNKDVEINDFGTKEF
jgi:hypothetical protein